MFRIGTCGVMLLASSCATVTRFEFTDPCTSMAANTDLWISANETGSLIGEHVRGRIGDDTKLKRLGVVMTELWWASGMRFYAHEVAHQINDANHGVPQSIGFDFSDIRTNLWPDFYDHEMYSLEKTGSTTEVIWYVASGINQDETTAKSLWRQSILSGSLPMHRAMMMGAAKLLDVYYTLSTGLAQPSFEADPDVTYTPLELIEPFSTERLPAWDPDVYYVLMEGSHHRVNKLDMLAHYALADIASWAAWWPIARACKYVKSGNDDVEVPTIKIAGTRFSPPIWNSYMTPEGFFHEISSIAGVGNDFPVEFSVGFPLRLGDKGYLSCFRFGARLWDTRIAKLTVSPYAYVCYHDDEQGGTLGVELSVGQKSNRVWIRGQYSEDDILENGVGRLSQGLKVTVGIEFKN